jgi:hypothetical protein
MRRRNWKTKLFHYSRKQKKARENPGQNIDCSVVENGEQSFPTRFEVETLERAPPFHFRKLKGKLMGEMVKLCLPTNKLSCRATRYHSHFLFFYTLPIHVVLGFAVILGIFHTSDLLRLNCPTNETASHGPGRLNRNVTVFLCL